MRWKYFCQIWKYWHWFLILSWREKNWNIFLYFLRSCSKRFYVTSFGFNITTRWQVLTSYYNTEEKFVTNVWGLNVSSQRATTTAKIIQAKRKDNMKIEFYFSLICENFLSEISVSCVCVCVRNIWKFIYPLLTRHDF